MNSSRFISAVLFGLACYLGSFSSIANEQAIEEIIVTARQQSEGLQDVPVTIAALTEEDLDRYNINNLVDAGKMVPNMVINTLMKKSLEIRRPQDLDGVSICVQQGTDEESLRRPKSIRFSFEPFLVADHSQVQNRVVVLVLEEVVAEVVDRA